jgi:hypothetical protein
MESSIDNAFYWINPVEKCTRSFRGATWTEENWRHDVFLSLHSQCRLLREQVPIDRYFSKRTSPPGYEPMEWKNELKASTELSWNRFFQDVQAVRTLVVKSTSL